MNETLRKPDCFFFGTRKLPCPYLDNHTERMVVTDLSGPNSADLYVRLSRAGFRRSHGLAYRPACPNCSSCVPVRIAVVRFKDTRSFRRIRRANVDLFTKNISAIVNWILPSRIQRLLCTDRNQFLVIKVNVLK